MAGPVVPADLAAALRYGPQTQSSLRKSQYLTDALKQIQASGSANIQSGGELAAKLLATAILQRGSNKADQSALTALKSDQDSETATLLGGLRGTPPAAPVMPQIGAPALQPQPASPPPLQAMPQSQPAPQPMPSAQPPQRPELDPQTDAIVRTVIGEAQGEDPVGQIAVANVILNRSKRAGKAPKDVVLERGQFEPWGNPTTRSKLESLSPSDPLYQQVLQNIAPALQGQDVTGGADHFYSPTAQSAAGRQPPAWDNGSGVDHGKHRFFSLGYGGQGAHQREQAPVSAFEQPQPDQRPVQIAVNGQVDPSMLQASAPAGPNGGGAAPAAAIPPQAAAAGANVQWPNWLPTQQQVDYVEGLMRDPRTHEQGVAEARKLRAKMNEPDEAQIIQQNGVSFYVSKTPGGNGQPVMIPIQPQAQTQIQTPQQLGVQAPQGTAFAVDPFGNPKEISRPQQGQQVASQPGQPYREQYIPGGSNDPTRPQAPQQSYQYAPGATNRQEAIPGGPADPRAPANYIEQVTKIQQQIRPVVDQAIQLKRNIDAVRTGYAQQNGPGDIAMVNGLQKLIDDGVVREGDVTLQLGAQGVKGGIAGARAYITSTGKFDPAIRASILKTADSLYGSINSNYRDRVLGYKGMANRLLGDQAFEDILPTSAIQSLGWSGQPQGNPPPAPNPAVVAPAGPAGSRDAAIAEARRRGLIK